MGKGYTGGLGAVNIKDTVKQVANVLKNKECCSCGTTENLEWGPDPYAEDIHNDPTRVSTHVWECSHCRYESAMDI